MNVVVMIQGREAIPVRAIPLLTDWETMDSGVIADVLAWDKAYKEFPGLQAFDIDDSLHPIKARLWKNLVCQQMKALNESIKAVEVNDETGLQEWRCRSLEILPAGVFVWRDEFEPLYERRYGPDGESVVSPSGVLPEDEHAECVALNFRPHISDPAIRELVMKGFECLRGAPVAISPSPNDKHVTHFAAAPVVAETVEQRRARYLVMFETEVKRNKRGVLQRVADREGVDRSNMSKDIDKARAIRTEQNRAGFFVSHLVQDGKRKG